MSNDLLELPTTDCLVFNTGSVICVPAVKYISKCDGDYTYWPYDQQKCRIVLGSWSYAGEEVDFHLKENGVYELSYLQFIIFFFSYFHHFFFLFI